MFEERRSGKILFSAMKVATLLGVSALLSSCNQPDMTPYDIKRAKEFVLSSLPPMPPDPSNRFSENREADKLGEKLFFDTGLSINSAVSCGLCHQPAKQFQDSIKVGFGTAKLKRRTMPLIGIQWGDWFFWDGRKDSQWSQALEPFETANEHGMTRDMVGREVLTRYRGEYQALFGEPPDITRWPYRVSPLVEGDPRKDWAKTPPAIQEEINLVFANIGKALASFQRTILPVENRVDRYLSAKIDGAKPKKEDMLTEDELAGFKLFTGKAKCDNCHSGPLYTDHFFHNTGVPIADKDDPDFGRAAILVDIKQDPFSCLGEYSDASTEDCRSLEFMSEDPKEFEGSFKTPSLRGVSDRAPYMHAGQFETLEEVVEHYLRRPDPFKGLLDHKDENGAAHNDAPEIRLSEKEKKQLIAFLSAL